LLHSKEHLQLLGAVAPTKPEGAPKGRLGSAWTYLMPGTKLATRHVLRVFLKSASLGHIPGSQLIRTLP